MNLRAFDGMPKLGTNSQGLEQGIQLAVYKCVIVASRKHISDAKEDKLLLFQRLKKYRFPLGISLETYYIVHVRQIGHGC